MDAVTYVAPTVVDIVVPNPFVAINPTVTWAIEQTSRCSREEVQEGIAFHYGCTGTVETFLLGVSDTAVTVGDDVFTYEHQMIG